MGWDWFCSIWTMEARIIYLDDWCVEWDVSFVWWVNIRHLDNLWPWLHVLLTCIQHHIPVLITKWHKKVFQWEIRSLLFSSNKSRCYIFMSARTFNNNLQKNTVLLWLLPCIYKNQKCYYNVGFELDILCVSGWQYQYLSSTCIKLDLIIQYIEFTYFNNRFSLDTITIETDKY